MRFLIDIIQHRIIPVHNDSICAVFELLHVVHDKATEKRRATGQGRLVDDDGGTFYYYAFLDALDEGLAKAVEVHFHDPVK